jgi:hypothetical protein
MKLPFTGGCLCGAIRYECSAEPMMMGNCHCRHCQQSTGTAFAAAILVPRNAVNITGEVTYYEIKGDSGNMVGRGFCPICGSRLFSKPPNPELLGIMAGGLDDPSGFQPRMDFYTASAQPWDLPKFLKLPSNETFRANGGELRPPSIG